MSDALKDVDVAAAKKPSPEVLYWGKELELSRKRLKKFRKQAADCVRLYEGDMTTENSFNILYSNTETLLPACYNQLPRPDVDRTFHDEDPIAKESAEALERVIKATVDSQNASYDQFHRLFQQATLGGLVAGQGSTRIFYDAEIKATPEPVGDSEAEPGSDAAAQDSTKPPFIPTRERVEYECISGKDLDFDQIIYGYARRWVDLPWLGFEHFMFLDDLVANFGKEVAEKVTLSQYAPRDEEDWKKKGDDDAGENNHGSQSGAHVTEIWNKAKREVVFYCESFPDKILEKRKDPFELSGFFPMCEPVKFTMKLSGTVPTPLYKLYEPQAKELNRLSVRINRILNAMKVRGFYDGSLQGLQDLLTADDNTLKPVPNAVAFTEGKTLANSIWFMPLNDLVTVLSQLMQGREQCKNTIYEITGISDIMRGDTQASETFGAQNLKSKWGTQRLQKFQGEVQRYCRDCYRIIGEMAAKQFSEETFAAMTGLPYAKSADVKKAQGVMQRVQQMEMAMQQQAAMAAQQAQAQQPLPGMPPAPPAAPPAPPQLPPQVQQAAQQAQAVLAKPPWEPILKLLRTDILRCYKIDIETNSTLDPTRQEDKQDITEAMTAMANTMQSFGPFVEQGVITMPVFKGMLKSIVTRFAFGRQLEDAIDAMPDQVPQTVNNTPQGAAAGPSPAEQAAAQAEAQLDMQATQAKAKLLTSETNVKAAEHQAAMARIAQEQQLEDKRHLLKMHEIDAEIAAQVVRKNTTEAVATTEVRKSQSLSDIQTGREREASKIKLHDATVASNAKTEQANADTRETTEKADTAGGLNALVAEMRKPPKPRKMKLIKNADGSKEIHEIMEGAE